MNGVFWQASIGVRFAADWSHAKAPVCVRRTGRQRRWC